MHDVLRCGIGYILFASAFDIIMGKPTKNVIKVKKNKNRKEKSEIRNQKTKYGVTIEGKTRLVSRATKLNILPEKFENERFEELYLLFPVGRNLFKKKLYMK